MAAASFVLCHLAGSPFQGEPIFSLPPAKCQAHYDRLLASEELRIGSSEEMQVDLQEVSFRGKSDGCSAGLSKFASSIVI